MIMEFSNNHKTKIGIIESNDLVLNCLNDLIKLEEEFNIVFAEKSGKAALAKLNSIKCDVLLTDENLFDINSIDFLTASRKLHPHINVLFLINEHSKKFFKEAAENRATTLISKYCDPEEMLLILKNVNTNFVLNEIN